LILLDTWLDIRTRHRDGETIKEIARTTGSSKNTVKKYLRSNAPPRQASPTNRAPLMARFEIHVDELLRVSPTIRAPRIVTILRERVDPTFRIGERAARMYVASRRVVIAPKEVFVRLVYAPGDQMQFDFKDVTALIGDVETKLHLFVARLSYSTKWFARCYRTEDRPALFDGLLEACKSFGGVPREGVFDNASTAVKRVLRGRKRNVNREFAEFCGSLALSVQFAAPAKGNEKGGVEGLNGYIEDNVFVPTPEGASLHVINEGLDTFCREDMKRVVGAGETVASRFARETLALRPLPTMLPSPCIREYARTNKFSEATHKTNRYSVPTAYAHQNAIVECYADRVRIVVGAEVIAEHARCFGKNQSILDPLHFLDLLSLKHRAVEHAAVFAHEGFPEQLKSLLRRYVENDRLGAGKNFIRVVSLIKQYPIGQLVDAVELARIRGTNDPEAIALILDQASQPQRAFERLRIDSAVIGATRPHADLNGYTTAMLKECA
jgi:transposase